MKWQLKRNDNKAVIHLHQQYWWRDEYEWTALAQSSPVYTLSGAMDIQQGTMQAGRPITLDCSHARISRADIKTLNEWSEVPELEMTLTHPDNREFKVIFARPAIGDITAIKNYMPADQQNDDQFVANLYFLTI